MKLKEWGAFILLSLVWGTSFLWIKIALDEIGPLLLVSLRLLFGVSGLLVVMAVTRNSFPRDWRTIGKFVLHSIFATALPFILVSWGETQIPSGLAAILNGTVPLFTIIFAHLILPDEKITLARLGGLLLGFAGVVVLMSRDLSNSSVTNSLRGQLAVVCAAASYAAGFIITRKYIQHQVPVVQSTMNLLIADVLLWTLTLTFERPVILPAPPITWLALAWLGLLGSCLAFLLYFYLVNNIGATRTSVVTYVMPVIGLLLGVVFLDEIVSWRLVTGLVLILSGIGIINLKPKTRSVALTSRLMESESKAK